MSIFSKVLGWIEGLFSKASKELQDIILPGVIAATNALKVITDLDTADLLGSVAGAAGKVLEEKVKSVLPGVIQKLQLAQQFKGMDPNTTLANILKLVGTSAPITQTAFWIEFSGHLNTDLQNDGKLDLGESAALLKYWYDNHPPAVKADASNAATAPAA
jgi:hypothetical protein